MRRTNRLVALRDHVCGAVGGRHDADAPPASFRGDLSGGSVAGLRRSRKIAAEDHVLQKPLAAEITEDPKELAPVAPFGDACGD